MIFMCLWFIEGGWLPINTKILYSSEFQCGLFNSALMYSIGIGVTGRPRPLSFHCSWWNFDRLTCSCIPLHSTLSISYVSPKHWGCHATSWLLLKGNMLDTFLQGIMGLLSNHGSTLTHWLAFFSWEECGLCSWSEGGWTVSGYYWAGTVAGWKLLSFRASPIMFKLCYYFMLQFSPITLFKHINLPNTRLIFP